MFLSAQPGPICVVWTDSIKKVERLRANRDLVPGALEEALRYYSPVKLQPRWAVTETTLGDQRIEAGQLLFAWIASANRDQAEFPNADQFHIERESNRHLDLGRGIHFCLGALLARLEAKIALNAMLDLQHETIDQTQISPGNAYT